MCLCVYVYMYVCTCVYVYMCTHLHVCVCAEQKESVRGEIVVMQLDSNRAISIHMALYNIMT